LATSDYGLLDYSIKPLPVLAKGKARVPYLDAQVPSVGPRQKCFASPKPPRTSMKIFDRPEWDFEGSVHVRILDEHGD
jgi:hypothetical protein